MGFVKLPSAKYLQECVDYCAGTGNFVWKARPRQHFKTEKIWKHWQSKFAGKPAFKTKDSSGHAQSRIDGVLYFAHRVAWKIMTGRDPNKTIDHKDRNPANNKWKNLRLAEHFENCANRNVPKNNKSGHVGVFFARGEGKWKAYVRVKQVRISLGTHRTKRAAIKARQTGAAVYYGEFAPK